MQCPELEFRLILKLISWAGLGLIKVEFLFFSRNFGKWFSLWAICKTFVVVEELFVNVIL